MKTEKVVVFDVDGTLFDTKPGIIKTLNEVLETFGSNSIKHSHEDNWIGPPVRESFKNFAKLSAEQAEEATKLYRKLYIEKYISYSFLYDGMVEVLKKLKKANVHICIATMKTSEQMERLLFLNNMNDIFESVKTAANDGSKTKADMLREIKIKFGEELGYYMVGDTEGDLVAAKSEKYSFLAALYGYGNFQGVQDITKIDNPRQLLLFKW